MSVTDDGFARHLSLTASRARKRAFREELDYCKHFLRMHHVGGGAPMRIQPDPKGEARVKELKQLLGVN